MFIKFKNLYRDNFALSYEQDPFDKNSFFVFFQDQKECDFKIYNDGGHFIGTLLKGGSSKSEEKSLYSRLDAFCKRYCKCGRSKGLSNEELFDFVKNKVLEVYGEINDIDSFIERYIKPKHCEEFSLDLYFDEIYVTAIKQIKFNRKKKEIRNSKIFEFIKLKILEEFGEIENLDDYIVKKLEIKFHNYFARLKRFKRKVNLNKWNYFTTFTYDGEKLSEDIFKDKLKKCLSNLSTRRGWKYMGVWERGNETDRLHFHAFMYVPEGEMVGKIEKRREYSTKTKRMETVYVNTFFEEAFGRNDFQFIKSEEMRAGFVLRYITKYISKTEQRIVYSRGIATEICKKISIDKVACFYEDFGLKFVFYDDILDWEEDIAHYTYQQVVMF